MQERKEGTKKAIKVKVGIVILLFDLLLLAILTPVIVVDGEKFAYAHYICIIFLIIISDALLSCVCYFAFENYYQIKRSKVLIKSKLSSDNYVEVIPTEVPARYYTFIKSELPALAKFFAILNEEGTGVRVEIKFNDHKEYHFFEYVYAEDFSSRYEIKE